MSNNLIDNIAAALQIPVSIGNVGGILWREMKERDKISDALIEYNKDLPPSERLRGTNIDKYFHQRGMYQAAQLGALPASVALAMGQAKEAWDGFRNRYIRGWDKQLVEQEKQKDLKNNYDAVIMGLNSKVPVEQVIKMPPTVQRLMEAASDKK